MGRVETHRQAEGSLVAALEKLERIVSGDVGEVARGSVICLTHIDTQTPQFLIRSCVKRP
jgi:hypothetical protein